MVHSLQTVAHAVAALVALTRLRDKALRALLQQPGAEQTLISARSLCSSALQEGTCSEAEEEVCLSALEHCNLLVN